MQWGVGQGVTLGSWKEVSSPMDMLSGGWLMGGLPARKMPAAHTIVSWRIAHKSHILF